VPIPIEQESNPEERCKEPCCFCRARTTWWTDIRHRSPSAQVACCEDCADQWRQMDVPSKSYWFAREKLLTYESAKSFLAGRQSVIREAQLQGTGGKVKGL